MMDSFIDQLFTPAQCHHLRAQWLDGDRFVLGQVIGKQLIASARTVSISNLVDALMLLCMTNSFSRDEDECSTVALLCAQGLRDTSPLPLLTRDRGLVLARKTLVSLTFFRPAMVARTERRGAPAPEVYRRVSQRALQEADYEQLADNHSRWEAFLSEVTV